MLEDKEMDDKENQHNELEDLISHSAGQPKNSDRVQSWVIVKKSTSSKSKAPATVIPGDSIVKNEYGSIIIIVRQGVPAPSPSLRHPPSLTPFFKSLFPLPSFLHPFLRYFRQFPHPHATPSCPNPTHQLPYT